MPIKNVKPIALCDTSHMSEKEWMLMRTGKMHNIPCTIGGSEVGSVFDLNPWVTSKELYDRKSGIKPQIYKEFNSENKEIGHLFEEFVQKLFILWFKKNHRIKLKECSTIEEFNACQNGIYNDKHFYQCGEKDDKGNLIYPFAVANIDGLIKINGRIGIMEYKTTAPHGEVGRNAISNWKNGKPPIYYEYQCRHYMKVLNLDFFFIVCAWEFSLSGMNAIYGERDYQLEDYIFSGELEFYNSVISQLEWKTDNCKTAALATYYTLKYGEPNIKRPPVKLDPAYFPLLERMLERTEKRKMLTQQLEEMDDKDHELINLLAPVIEDASYCFCKKGNKVISLDITIPKSRSICHKIQDNALCKSAHLDYERLMRERPDIWEKYQTQVFDVEKFKLQNTALFNAYKMPAEPTGEMNRYTAKMRKV